MLSGMRRRTSGGYRVMAKTDSTTWWTDKDRSISVTLCVYDYMCNNSQYRVTATTDSTTWWENREGDHHTGVNITLSMSDLI